MGRKTTRITKDKEGGGASLKKRALAAQSVLSKAKAKAKARASRPKSTLLKQRLATEASRIALEKQRDALASRDDFSSSIQQQQQQNR